MDKLDVWEMILTLRAVPWMGVGLSGESGRSVLMTRDFNGREEDNAIIQHPQMVGHIVMVPW